MHQVRLKAEQTEVRPISRSSTGDRYVLPSVVEAVGRTSHGVPLPERWELPDMPAVCAASVHRLTQLTSTAGSSRGRVGCAVQHDAPSQFQQGTAASG
jgi:hypothetical protein